MMTDHDWVAERLSLEADLVPAFGPGSEDGVGDRQNGYREQLRWLASRARTSLDLDDFQTIAETASRARASLEKLPYNAGGDDACRFALDITAQYLTVKDPA